MRRDNTDRVRKFITGYGYTAMLLVLLCIAAVTGNEIVGTVVLSLLASVCLLLTEDITPCIETVLVTVCLAIRCKYSFNDFWHYRILAIPIIVFIVSHFIIYPVKPKKGECFRGIFAASVAITLGGVGSLMPIQYFSETSIFYIVMLGFAQLLLYCFAVGFFQRERSYDVREKLCKAMVSIIPALTICLVQEYLSRWAEFSEKWTVIPFQWRNNCATLLMLAMPFAFYYARKHFSAFYLGFLSLAAIVLSGSRGGLIFGVIEFMLCTAVLFACDKEHRKYIVITAAVIAALAVLQWKALLELVEYTIERLFSVKENSIRLELIPRCIDDFKTNPLFGRGLIYMGNRDVHKSAKFTLCWYHNSLAQVIGSMGICGIVGYAFLNYQRIRVFVKNINSLSAAFFLSFIGLEMMSLVNPGIFAPFPYLSLITLFFAAIETKYAQPAGVQCDKKE